jgi:RNA polymerase sigma factor (sigma-70 family)
MNRLMCHLRRAIQTEEPRPSDGELLACFIERREETAFAALLRRHGPMVLGVCQRILRNPHDADDAFQATFLVLVRKADSVSPREAVGNWLYGVAYRTALEARTRIARQHARERELVDTYCPERHDDCWPELQAVLDRELHRLPDKYRLAVVLCDVEGRSRKEVARQLAIPEGTLSSRLATARKKLSARLTRVGFTLTSVALASLLAENAAMAFVPPALFHSTTKAAVLLAAQHTLAAGVVSATVTALTEGVVKTMFVAKIKTAMMVVCSVTVLGLGTGGVLYQTRAGAADTPQGDNKQATEFVRTTRMPRIGASKRKRPKSDGLPTSTWIRNVRCARSWKGLAWRRKHNAPKPRPSANVRRIWHESFEIDWSKRGKRSWTRRRKQNSCSTPRSSDWPSVLRTGKVLPRRKRILRTRRMPDCDGRFGTSKPKCAKYSRRNAKKCRSSFGACDKITSGVPKS